MSAGDMSNTVNDADLVAVATDVWTTMLGRDLTLVPSGACATPTPTIDGVVSITGGWAGAVVVRLARPLACRIAAGMFDLDGMPAPADIQDAVGEIANTTGGNIKGLLPGFCHLSLPTVVDGSDFRLRVPGAAVVSRLQFSCEDELVMVELIAAGAAETHGSA